MKSNDPPYASLTAHMKEVGLLGGAAVVLGWDQEVLMPPKGVAYRAEQLAQLARMTHEMSTDPRVGDWLSACEDQGFDDPLSEEAVNVRELRRDYDRSTKLPAELVAEQARTASMSKAAWAEARQASDFERFRPWLEKTIDLQRRIADAYGYPSDGEPWDALAEGYEPGCTAAQVEAVFTPLRERLARLTAELMDVGVAPEPVLDRLTLPVEQQEKFVRFVAGELGFDFDAGRLDRSTHPFCGGAHQTDVRMTTRFHDDLLGDALGSTMHETGHAIYAQNTPDRGVGLPMSEPVSLSIHESQSRLWENQVGRSEAFWRWCFPKLAGFFGDAVAGLDQAAVYRGMNRVQPSLIRVEADEATYNLHIMIRFELERRLIRGELTPAGLPAAWNDLYQQTLGLDVPDDARGCLQDIHWSMGAFGYFPTYTLGNLYAAQFFEQASADLPGLEAQFAQGDFKPLRTWLTEKIHTHAMRYRSAELCEHVTGKPLSADPLMRHLESKLKPIYGV